MPNVEIHGLSRESGEVMYSQAERLLRGAPFADEVVISIMGDVVRDLKGYQKPFLRIFSADEAEAHQVMSLLKPLDLRYEPRISFVGEPMIMTGAQRADAMRSSANNIGLDSTGQ